MGTYLACLAPWIKCRHRNGTKDQFDGAENVPCSLHPIYCASNHEDWLSRHPESLPDCAALTVENFPKYLYDFTPWVIRLLHTK